MADFIPDSGDLARDTGEERGKEHSGDSVEPLVQNNRNIINNCLTRADGEPVIMKNLGFELTLTDFLAGRNEYTRQIAHELIQKHIKDKRVLVVPAYGTNPFIFKLIGAKEVVGADADPVTLEWQSAIQKHFGTQNIGSDLMARVEYPDSDAIYNLLGRCKKTGKTFGSYILGNVRSAVVEGADEHPLEGVRFSHGALGSKKEFPVKRLVDVLGPEGEKFDCIFVPFLLGIKNGVESAEGIAEAYNDIRELGKNGSMVMIAPFSDSESGIWKNFGSSDGIEKELRNKLSPDAFEIVSTFPLHGVECALIRIKKNA